MMEFIIEPLAIDSHASSIILKSMIVFNNFQPQASLLYLKSASDTPEFTVILVVLIVTF